MFSRDAQRSVRFPLTAGVFWCQSALSLRTQRCYKFFGRNPELGVTINSEPLGRSPWGGEPSIAKRLGAGAGIGRR